MLNGFMAVLILFFVALVSGTLVYPTQDDVVLLLSSAGILAVAWMYRRQRQQEQQDTEG